MFACSLWSKWLIPSFPNIHFVVDGWFSPYIKLAYPRSSTIKIMINIKPNWISYLQTPNYQNIKMWVVVFLCWQHIWGCSLPSMLPLQCKLCLKINGVIVGRTSSTILVHLRDPIWACPYTKTCIQPRYYILSQLCQNWTHLSSKKKKVFYGLCEARKNFHAFISLGAFQWTWNLHTTCWCEGHINTLSLTYFMISHLYVQNDFISKTSKRSKYFTN